MKTAKLFQNGQSQAVRLPKEFRFEGDEVFIIRRRWTSLYCLWKLLHLMSRQRTLMECFVQRWKSRALPQAA